MRWGGASASGPRACGAVPPARHVPLREMWWSPRVRGCSHGQRRVHHRRPVVPARAGLFRGCFLRSRAAACGPRACGAVPNPRQLRSKTCGWSPRVRGCSQAIRPHARELFSGPRACGAVPSPRAYSGIRRPWSPRVRGCSRVAAVALLLLLVVPARAGLFPARRPRRPPSRGGPRACGAVPDLLGFCGHSIAWSPRVRGCSRGPDHVGVQPGVVPARAGLFPRAKASPTPSRSGPRACGAVPWGGCWMTTTTGWSPRVRGCSPRRAPGLEAPAVVPARAGLFPHRRTVQALRTRGPRACGAVPRVMKATRADSPWSPRVRGCSLSRYNLTASDVVVPARAGLFPSATPSGHCLTGGPRACGAVPVSHAKWALFDWWSPRVRGCSRGLVVPARAGLFPGQRVLRGSGVRGPRACGAVPQNVQSAVVGSAWSPRVRGCSPIGLRVDQALVVVPARAGLFPTAPRRCQPPERGPRACGAVPGQAGAGELSGWWSPRVRGCSRYIARAREADGVVPARAGLFPRHRASDRRPLGGPRACGAVPLHMPTLVTRLSWSPRVRGCSHGPKHGGSTAQVVPARAGLFPPWPPWHVRCSSGPRACGAVPVPTVNGYYIAHVVPARAGLFPGVGATADPWHRGPRACGAVPCPLGHSATPREWSPRVRGCSLEGARGGQQVVVVPARAGLFPRAGHPGTRLRGGPRACGAVPQNRRLRDGGLRWSPRVRGCSPEPAATGRRVAVVPARAGLFPGPRPHSTSSACGPRACGAVPMRTASLVGAAEWSPRVRGCSRRTGGIRLADVVVPARAGLFPPPHTTELQHSCGPRACGAVPGRLAVPLAKNQWSPRVRGCSPAAGRSPRRAGVVPARAGLFPLGGVVHGAPGRGPRACRAVPDLGVIECQDGEWSPRVRGCSRTGSSSPLARLVVPARAGLFPSPAPTTAS